MSRSLLAFWAALLCVATLSAHAREAPLFAGRVVAVADGDTLTVLDATNTQHKIRLTGIDAPESGQAFGNRSKQALADCAHGKRATLLGNKKDRYGRTIARVIVNGVDCNSRQLNLGMAWHYKRYEMEQPTDERERDAAAETKARSAGIGLWRETSAQAPWEWRATHAESAQLKESRGECDCAIAAECVGRRGAFYCITDTGKRRYTRD